MHNYSELKFSNWYVVEVSFRKTNPIHRAILSDYRDCDHTGTLTGSYEPASLEFFDLNELYYFKVIKEIPEMSESCWHMPPERNEQESSCIEDTLDI